VSARPRGQRRDRRRPCIRRARVNTPALPLPCLFSCLASDDGSRHEAFLMKTIVQRCSAPAAERRNRRHARSAVL
jgi:hypothetical protein